MCLYEPLEFPPRGGSSAVDVLGRRRSSQACRQHPSCESASRVTAEEHCRMAADSTARAHQRTVMGSGVCPRLPWAFPPGPHPRLQSRCWSGLWARRGSSGERRVSELGLVVCNQSPLSVGRPAGLILLPPLLPVACSSLLSRRLVSFSQPGSVSPRRLTEHAHIHPGYPTHPPHTQLLER